MGETNRTQVTRSVDGSLRDRIIKAIQSSGVLVYRNEWEPLADAVIGKLDTALLDFGLWLAEEITGRQMTRIDMESCITDWKDEQ